MGLTNRLRTAVALGQEETVEGQVRGKAAALPGKVVAEEKGKAPEVANK